MSFLQWDGARLEGSGWQGIRYLELKQSTELDTPSKLLIHLALDPGEAQDIELRFGGGRRVTELRATVTTVSPPFDPDPRIEVALPVIGDHAPYTVTLVGDGASTHAIHPLFATAEFVFTLDCELGDCRPQAQARPAPEPKKRPAVDLLAKDYSGFVQLLADRIKVKNPHWADLAPASFERVLLELFAHHADMLSYYQDRVANEAFVQTARQRHTLRQHGMLLGYRLNDGRAATTEIAFQVEKTGWLPAGLSIEMAGQPHESRVVFYVPHTTRVVAEHSRLVIAGWPGATNARIPAGATELLLWGQSYELAPGNRLVFVLGTFTQVVTLTAVQPIAQPGWTSNPKDTSISQVPQPLTRIEWREPLAQAVMPWVEHVAASGSGPFSLYGNLVTLIHGEERRAFLNPEKTGDLRRNDVIIELTRQNSIMVRDFRGESQWMDLLRALRVPEGPVTFVGKDGDAEPALELQINGEHWHRVDHLHNSQSFDHHYVATSDENGLLWLHFGDGIRGRQVVAGGSDTNVELAVIEIRYRVGTPIAGNCAAGTLRRYIPPDDKAEAAQMAALGTVTLTHLVPGTGGIEPESADSARLAIPASLRHGQLRRAVTLEDYAAVAQRVPGVSRAVARSLGGAFDTVLVLVDPEDQSRLSSAVAGQVERAIDAVRMAGREHRVAQARPVPLEVELVLCVAPGEPRHRVRDAAYAALRPGDDANPGFFHPDRLTIGEVVEQGDLIAAVQRVPGVRTVSVLTFRRRAPGAPRKVPRIVLSSYELARLDADDDFPENGTLRVRVVGIDEPKGFHLLEGTA